MEKIKNFIINNKKKVIWGLGILIVILVVFALGSFIFGYKEVTFDSKGGTSVPIVRVEKGKSVNKPNTPVLQGYVFDGWYLNDELYDFNTPITENITLTGKWHSAIQK